MKRLFGCAVVLFATSAAGAQQAAPPTMPAAAPGVIAVTKHACIKPDYPGRMATPIQMKVFDREMEALRKCMTDYAAEQKKAADALASQSTAHIAAANAAIAEYNDHIKSLNKAAGREEENK